MKMLDRMWEGCGHCHGEADCPMLQEARQTYEANAWFQGRTLVLTALIIFILPLALALIGGWSTSSGSPLDAKDTSTAQVIGVLAGLIAGAGLAPLLLRLCRIHRPVAADVPPACANLPIARNSESLSVEPSCSKH
jgi:hypothetical protein